MTLPQTDNGEYGFGFWLDKTDHFPYFQGSDPGVSFISSYDAEKRLIITIACNLGQDISAMHKDIKNIFNSSSSLQLSSKAAFFCFQVLL